MQSRLSFRLSITLILVLVVVDLSAQSFLSDFTFQWETGLSIKSSNLQLNSINEHLINAGYLTFDNYTQEVNFLINVRTAEFPLGMSIGISNGGAVHIAADRKSYSNVRVSYLSLAGFVDLFRWKRLTLRSYITYESGSYRGEFYINNTTVGTTLNNLSGSTILNHSIGVKPVFQLQIDLGKKRRNSVGFDWSYFYRISQQGWRYFPSGPATNLPDLKNGEQAISFVFLHRFYNHVL